MAIDKIQSESINLGDNFAFTGTVSGAGGTNTPLFKAYRNSNQAIPNNTWTKYAFNSETYDPSGVYDASTNYRFTPGVAGYYYIQATMRSAIDNDFNYYLIKIIKNGTGDPICAVNNSHFDTETISCGIIDLADADDYYEVYLLHNKGTTENFGNGGEANSFMAFKLTT